MKLLVYHLRQGPISQAIVFATALRTPIIVRRSLSDVLGAVDTAVIVIADGCSQVRDGKSTSTARKRWRDFFDVVSYNDAPRPMYEASKMLPCNA